MAPRAYNNESRLARQAELKSRIAAAAARLHRAKGALATSHAEIAKEAGVSLPTVYKHFPDLDELVEACTSHVIGQAPPFPAGAILAAEDLAAAAKALADAADASHAYFHPWSVWREEAHIPALAKVTRKSRAEMLRLCRQVLERHLGPDRAKPVAAWWESLLSFEMREQLVTHHRMDRAEYRRSLAALLLAVAAAPRSNRSPKSPKRKERT